MDPKEALTRAVAFADKGELQAAIDLLDPVLEEFREYGPAYLLHAKVFLMAGEAAQPLVDLDAAEWANREYGTSADVQDVIELRAITYAVRSIYGGQKEAVKCRECVEELQRLRAPAQSWWLLPAACYELDYREADAQAWVDKLSNYPALKSACSFFFTKKAGLTQLLAMPKNPEEMIPVHYARHFRARREGDRRGADKYRKRMAELIKPGDLWTIIDLYASGAVTVSAV
jgi:hypothetical protein